MRILFVAFADSVHTTRWINQIADQGWDIHLFPALDSRIHPDLKNLTVHDCIIRPPHLRKRRVRVAGGCPWPFVRNADQIDYLLKRLRQSEELVPWVTERSQRLARVIRRVKPDIIHSLEIQHAGYLTLEARNHLGDPFPTWIVTNWGSDIYLFGRLPDHADKIREVLAACDYYSCECRRDVELGRAFGFKGEVLPVLPNAGGFDLEWASQFRQPGPTSARRLIMLKGYQTWAGRALVGLRALELCADVLKGYRVAVYLANSDVALAAELVSDSTKTPVDIIQESSHEKILRLHGRARISIGLSIGDAISTSFLEAMVMGSFPVQSCTGCADEWVRDGETGLLVPPEDPQVIAAAIRRAVTDDNLVDRAAERNAMVASKRLERSIIQPQVIAMYRRIATQATAMKNTN